MTRLILYVLIFVSFNANAEWLKLPDSDIASNYIEVPVLKRASEDNYAQAWLLQDFFEPQALARSMKAVNEFDCKNNSVRTLRLVVYYDPMADGAQLAAYDAPKKMSGWHAIPRGSFAESAKKIACKF